MTSRLDPLFLWGIEWAVTESFGETPLPSGQTARTEEVETWGWVIEEIEEPESDPDVVRSAVCMGPDQWVKYGMSGSGWAGVRAPSATMDGEFFNDAYRAPFIDYLRLCFRWGGLPGLRDPATRSAAVEHDLAFLTADLLPL